MMLSRLQSRSATFVPQLWNAARFQSTFATAAAAATTNPTSSNQYQPVPLIEPSQLAEIVERANTKIMANPKYFANISPDSIQWIPKASRDSMVVPTLVNSAGETIIEHLTPFLPVKYGAFSHKGNTGQKVFRSERVLSEPEELSYEISLGNINKDDPTLAFPWFQAYADWLKIIEKKFIDHVIAERAQYGTYLKKHKNLDDNALRGIISSHIFSNVKEMESKPEEKYIGFKQKMFVPATKEMQVKDSSFKLEGDREIFAQKKLLRLQNRLYDSAGNLVPLEQRSVRSSDIVSIDVFLSANAYEQTGFPALTFRRSIQSATLLPRVKRERTSTNASPLGSILEN